MDVTTNELNVMTDDPDFVTEILAIPLCIKRKRNAPTYRPDQRAKRRKEAFIATHKSAAKVTNVYNKKHGQNIRTFQIGDTVTVGIPKLDRTANRPAESSLPDNSPLGRTGCLLHPSY